MINYNLAKQLKDAGFPQELKYGDLVIWNGREFIHTGGGHREAEGKLEGYFYDKGQTCCNDDDNLHFVSIHNDQVIKVPTLSELVEACGDEFHCIEKSSAGYVVLRKNDKQHHDFEVVYGSTPEEAVAKFWLELNKHEKE